MGTGHPPRRRGWFCTELFKIGKQMNIIELTDEAEKYLCLPPSQRREQEIKQLLQIAITELKARAKPCVWAEDENGNWNTGCGDIFDIIEGSPSENSMLFCHYCGQPIKEHLFRSRGNKNEELK